MKARSVFQRLATLLLLILLLCELFSCAAPKVQPTELGIPLASRYPEGEVARCPWDMVMWEDRLYVSSGDYGPNDGPVDIWCYDTRSGEWVLSGSVPDEEISHFLQWQGQLIAPGIDPRDGWEMGNYYVLGEQGWETVRTIPYAVHNFDIVEYEGTSFFGLGVVPGGIPVACSKDGQTFFGVDMYKDGAPIDTTPYKTVRVYDLFVLNDTLYAALLCLNDESTVYELYRYENGVLIYDNTWYQKIYQKPLTNNIITAKAVFGEKLFLTTGYLYVTDDMNGLTHIAFPENETVYDLCLAEGALYALCGTALEEGGYEVSVWKNTRGGNTQFSRAFHFVYDVPPLSLTVDGNVAYIGMGDGKNEHEKNGMILSVTLD